MPAYWHRSLFVGGMSVQSSHSRHSIQVALQIISSLFIISGGLVNRKKVIYKLVKLYNMNYTRQDRVVLTFLVVVIILADHFIRRSISFVGRKKNCPP